MKFYTFYWYAHSKMIRPVVSACGQLNNSSPSSLTKQIIMRINLIAIIIGVAFANVSANVKAQDITLKTNKASLKTVFDEIKKQTGYFFWYEDELLKNTDRVSLDLKNASLKETLDACFRNQPLVYTINDKTIVVKLKEKPLKKANTDFFKELNINGKVVDENGQPLPGAAIKVKGTLIIATTNNEGNFTIFNAPDNAVLIVSYIGFETKEFTATNIMTISLSRITSKLDEVQVIAYGTTTKRLNTGSVATVSAKDIENQPVSNPLATLIGRVPGLVVTQQSGAPGSSFSVQIRGRNSISQGSQPLILIDGIPFAAGNENIQLISSGMSNTNQGSGVSPFNSINPADIESIEILKDADATAIYGSRGANGVMLITTKKGKAGSTQVTANINQGITQVGQLPTLLNTEQYIAMRKEAFTNAGTTPTVNNAPDLLVWDTNRYTDYQKEFLGGTGNTTNANISISGGGAGTQFLMSGSYYRETSIYPGELPNQRGSMLANINHRSTNQRLNLAFSGSFTSLENKAPTTDLTYYTYISPNTPSFFDTDGSLKWNEGSSNYENPYSYLKEAYSVRSNNWATSLNASYKILDQLSAKVLLGYNQLFTNEQLLSPSKAKNPVSSIQGPTTRFGRNQYSTWNVEPQLEYAEQVWKGKLNVLVGATLNARNNNNLYVEGSGYSSDALMEAFDAAATIDASSLKSQYRYQAVFSRINYNIADKYIKYILNLTGRRDGSSRFGPGKQFANFGAVGAAWVFSSEKWMQNIPVLSFGKLRASYGVTGNDQIGDYQFVETWEPSSLTYQGASGLTPSTIYNAGYAWEKNNKLEAAIDLGFLKDRILLSVNYFQNRSGNQLINYRLPYTTGFNSILSNFPAKVENKGWEFTLSGTVVNAGAFKWDSNVNFTLPKNNLLDFPDIASSSYNNTYKVGQSLNIVNSFVYTGVDPQTGLVKLLDVNNNGTFTTADYQVLGNRDPKFFGGWQNSFSFKGLEIQIFLDFKKQFGRNSRFYDYNSLFIPGTMRNQQIAVLRRWQNIGDITDVPKFMPSSTTTTISGSGYGFSDQSYIRLRNVALSYNLPRAALNKIGVKLCRFYLQGQNLYTFNRDKGYDSETQNINVLPALRAYTLGVQISY